MKLEIEHQHVGSLTWSLSAFNETCRITSLSAAKNFLKRLTKNRMNPGSRWRLVSVHRRKRTVVYTPRA